MSVVRAESGEFRPLQIYEQVREHIRVDIRSGKFPPDTRLPSERDLASRFSVGRPAIREAIGALQNEGLVITRRNSGTYVASAEVLAEAAGHIEVDGSASDFSPSATLDVRLILEPAIARRAAARGQRDDLAELYLSQMESLTDVADPEQRALWNSSDRLFHRQLAAMTGDALLVKIAEEIAASMDQSLWKRLKDDGIYDPKRIKLTSLNIGLSMKPSSPAMLRLRRFTSSSTFTECNETSRRCEHVGALAPRFLAKPGRSATTHPAPIMSRPPGIVYTPWTEEVEVVNVDSRNLHLQYVPGRKARQR